MSPRTRARVLVPVLFALMGCTVVTTEPSGGGGGGSSSGGYGGSSGSGSGSSGGGQGGTSSGGSFGSPDANACQPGIVATFQPGTYHPASGQWQGACVPDASGDPITGFYDSCLGANATSPHCSAFRETYTACVACLLTPASADRYGPLIDNGDFVTANVAGCIELAGDQPDASQLFCAGAVQALAGCETAACQANCAVHDAASLAAYESCATASDSGGCATFSAAASCADADIDAGGLAGACLGDFVTFYHAAAPRFCGLATGTPFDAGTPGPGFDGATE
jgi:hypothetical protein